MRIFVFQSAATADEQISDMNIENYIEQAAARAVERLYPQAAGAPIQIQRTRREFEGDYTLVVFPLLKASRKAPEATAAEIGEALVAGDNGIESYNVVKGFLNMTLRRSFWNEKIAEIASDDHFGYGEPTGRTVMVEYSSPNTNKPLHLGHIRNNLLGYSVAEILKANGNRVIKANLVNDRGIHICKSMLAWQKFGGGETPASSGMKGDHLVGKYYVEFDRHYKEEVRELVAQGQSEEEAKRNAPIMREAQEMLRRWEAKEPETYALWETMNGWVYDGFDKTYAALGIDFDKTYYESQTYLPAGQMQSAGLLIRAAQLPDGAAGCREFLLTGSALHCQKAAADLDQRQAVFGQHRQSRHRAGRGKVELFPPALAGCFLSAFLGELHPGQAQLAAGIFQKLHPLAGRLHQGQFQFRFVDLGHDAGEACPCADVHHLPCHFRLRGKEQAVEEVFVLDALRVGDGGQVDLLVILHQNLCKGVQLVELGPGQRNVPRGTLFFQSVFVDHRLFLFVSGVSRVRTGHSPVSFT